MTKFTKEFKEQAIKLKKQGIHPNEIFRRYNINIESKQKDYANKLINRWENKQNLKRKLSSKDIKILSKISNKKKDKKIAYLETKIAYLEAENRFLANLPKKKKN